MADPMDIFSKPLKRQKTRFGILFEMRPRKNQQKPGRELIVNFDSRLPVVKNFKINYSYLVKFQKIGSVAGNHYHLKKQELFVPVVGKFAITLQDIKLVQQETIEIDSGKSQVFYVKPKTAHRVRAKTRDAILLVLATSANTVKDEFEYQIK